MTFDSRILLKADPPWILWLVTQMSGSVDTEEQLLELGITARVLRGKRMRTKLDLFDEFALHLSFPEYFGRNWTALTECLEDLEWLHGLAYGVVVDSANEVLSDESPEELEILFRILERVGAQWAQPVTLGEDWDRPSVPFHWVLGDSPEGRMRLQARLGIAIPGEISL